MIAKWDFNDSGNATTSVDVVGGYIGTFSGAGGRSAAGLGRTGAAGDFAYTGPGRTTGAMISSTSPFLTALNAAMGTQTISFTYWQNLTAFGNSAFYAFSPSSTTNRGLNAHSPWLSGAAFFEASGNTGSSTYNTPLGATLNTWQLVTMIYNNGVKSIYRDSTLVGTSAAGTTALKTDMNLFRVGNGDSNYGVSGRMDDFTIWQGALTLSEINSLIPESSTTAMIALLAIGAAVRRKRSCN